MLPNKWFSIVQTYALSVVHSHLIMFLNPKARGPQFSWRNFEDLCVGMGLVYGTQIPNLPKRHKKSFDLALEESIRHHAKNALKQSGLLEKN